MSRDCEIFLVDQLEAAERWKQHCWVQQLSLFGEGRLWTAENFEGLKHHFVDAPDTGGDGFLPTLSRQLKDAPSGVQRLATEVVWLLYVFPRRTIGPDKKRENLRAIAAIGGLALPIEHWALRDEALQGIGSTGTFYNTGLWIEFAFAVLVFQRLFALPDDQRMALADPSSALAEWLDGLDLPAALPGGQPVNRQTRQFRHIFLYLMQPDRYERISSSAHKRKIVKALASQIGAVADLSSAQALDAQLLAIRQHFEALPGAGVTDFYRPPLHAMWTDSSTSAAAKGAAPFQMIDQRSDGIQHWLVNGSSPSGDLTSSFVSEGRWECTAAGDSAHLVKAIRIGDRIAIKQSSTRSKNLPFETHGHKVGCMEVKARGVVTANPADGINLSVAWEADFTPLTLYRYSYYKPVSRIDEVRLPEVVQWVFNDVPQPLEVEEEEEMDDPELMAAYGPAPRNVIFYGPPGTGKTHRLLTDVLPYYTDEPQTESEEERLVRVASGLSWFEVLGAALIDLGKSTATVPEIRAHRFVQARLGSAQSRDNVGQRIWGALQSHTVLASTTVKYSSRVEPLVFDKTAASGWQLVAGWQQAAPELLDAHLALSGKGEIQARAQKRYEMVTFHPSFAYEDFVEGLRPVQVDGDVEEGASIEIKPAPGALMRICERARNDPDRRYALVIDEINRGNIAKIFGELITLVEADKRLQLDDAGEVVGGIEVKLPYTAAPFGVPANVDFYGTMNTSDRSIALVDIALRRRFIFRELGPDPEVIEGVDGEGLIDADDDGDAVDLRRILRVLNARLTVLRGRDARIGHAYLTAVEDIDALRAVFRDRIIPLLQEHFFEDWGQIGQVLAVRDGAPPFVVGSKPKVSALFFRDADNLAELAEMPLWRISPELPAASFRGLYDGVPDAVLDLP